MWLYITSIYLLYPLQNLGILYLLSDSRRLSDSHLICREFLTSGDFNIHVDDLTGSNVIQFLSLLDHTNLTQHVWFPLTGILTLLILCHNVC